MTLTPRKPRILLIEDRASDAGLTRSLLRQGGPCVVAHRTCLADGLALLGGGEMDLVFLDMGLPDNDGVGGVTLLRATAPEVPVVILTGTDDERLAEQALDEGAQDYLLKDEVQGPRPLWRAMRYAWARAAAERGFQSACAVPLTDRGVQYGALAVYATDPGAFAEMGETLVNLGETVGYGAASKTFQ